jgi:hypothetical protein
MDVSSTISTVAGSKRGREDGSDDTVPVGALPKLVAETTSTSPAVVGATASAAAAAAADAPKVVNPNLPVPFHEVTIDDWVLRPVKSSRKNDKKPVDAEAAAKAAADAAKYLKFNVFPKFERRNFVPKVWTLSGLKVSRPFLPRLPKGLKDIATDSDGSLYTPRTFSPYASCYVEMRLNAHNPDHVAAADHFKALGIHLANQLFSITKDPVEVPKILRENPGYADSLVLEAGGLAGSIRKTHLKVSKDGKTYASHCTFADVTLGTKIGGGDTVRAPVFYRRVYNEDGSFNPKNTIASVPLYENGEPVVIGGRTQHRRMGPQDLPRNCTNVEVKVMPYRVEHTKDEKTCYFALRVLEITFDPPAADDTTSYEPPEEHEPNDEELALADQVYAEMAAKEKAAAAAAAAAAVAST